MGTSAQLSHCCLFVSFLQKWNTQLIVPASSASTQNSAVGGKRSRVDSFGANRSFPVEQLQTFPQLLQNIHRLEVSGRKVSSSVLGKQKTFVCDLTGVWCVGNLIQKEHLVLRLVSRRPGGWSSYQWRIGQLWWHESLWQLTNMNTKELVWFCLFTLSLFLQFPSQMGSVLTNPLLLHYMNCSKDASVHLRLYYWMGQTLQQGRHSI